MATRATAKQAAQAKQAEIKQRLSSGTIHAVTPTYAPTPTGGGSSQSFAEIAAQQSFQQEAGAAPRPVTITRPTQIVTKTGGVTIRGLPPETKTLQTLDVSRGGRIIRATAEVVQPKPKDELPAQFVPDFTHGGSEDPRVSAERIKEIQKEERNPFKQFWEGVKEAGLVTAALGRDTQVQAIEGGTFAEKSRQAGRLGGTILDLVTFTQLPKLVTGVKAGVGAAQATKAGKTVISGITAFESIPLGQTAVGVGKVTFAGLATTTAVTKAVEFRAGIKPTEYKDVFNIAMREERKSVPGLKGLVAQAVPTAFGKEDVFVKVVRKELKKKGLSGGALFKEVERLREERRLSRFAELTGILAAGAASEAVGRGFVQRNILETPTFTGLFREIGKAGFAEGFGQTVVAHKARKDPRDFFTGKTPHELAGLTITTTPAIEALGFGGLGFLSAGLLGGSIGIASVKGKPKVRRTLEAIGFALDPTEYPSDLLESTFRAIPSKLSIRVPTVTPAISSGKKFTSVETQSLPDAVFGEFIPRLTVVPVSTKTTTPVKTPTLADTIGLTITETPTTIPIDITPIVPVPVTPIVPVPVTPIVPVPVTTTVPVPVTTPVPVITPIFKGIPPILPFFPLGTGGKPGKKAKGRVSFVDELKLTRGLFIAPPPKRTAKRRKLIKQAEKLDPTVAFRSDTPTKDIKKYIEDEKLRRKRKRGRKKRKSVMFSPNVPNLGKMLFG